ncbi:kinase-like domain-containing protein, partial [Rhizoctonia solani]
RELYTWSNCKHPNVLQLFGLAMFRGRIGMVSPWMNHGTLPQYLDSHPEVDRYSLCVQICDGLAYLHDVGIVSDPVLSFTFIELEKVHGDLKGANVLTLADGTPVLTDFGNSTFAGRGLLFTETTRDSGLTDRWAAPELLEGPGKPSKAADVYALGMEVITGKLPYSGKGDLAVLKLVSDKKHPDRPNEHIPESRGGNKFWRLLEKCWAYESKKRPSAAKVTTNVSCMNACLPLSDFASGIDEIHHTARFEAS